MRTRCVQQYVGSTKMVCNQSGGVVGALPGRQGGNVLQPLLAESITRLLIPVKTRDLKLSFLRHIFLHILYKYSQTLRPHKQTKWVWLTLGSPILVSNLKKWLLNTFQMIHYLMVFDEHTVGAGVHCSTPAIYLPHLKCSFLIPRQDYSGALVLKLYEIFSA